MKVIKYLGLMFFLSLFLLACQEEPYLELTGPTSIAVNEGVLLTIDSNIEGALEWSSSDSSVLTVEDGIVQGIKAGQATVRVGFSAFSLYQELTITVYSLETAEEIAINQLAQTILASIPNETMQDLNLITYDETSKATITYQSNQEEALTNLGKITRTTDDVRVKLKITIKINDTSGFFEKTVVVRKLTALNLTGDFTLT